jgi:hypothetical protein
LEKDQVIEEKDLRNVIVSYYIEEGKAPVFFQKFVDED